MSAKKRRAAIIGGAPISNYDAVRAYLRADDFIVACDAGLSHTDALGIVPDLIVGDFDSHPRPDTEIETIALPCEKDDTDTVYAVRECVRRGFCDFLLLGVFGARLDHTIGNIGILLYLDSLGLSALAVDDVGDMRVVSRTPVTVGDCAYFSLLAVDGIDSATLTVTGAKYSVSHAAFGVEYQYGVSNEIADGADCASVAVERGRVLLYRVR